MKSSINPFAALRCAVGLVFLVSGFEKLIVPYQNFLYVVQSYEFVPAGVDTLVARIFPWVEFFLGLFTVLGLWTQWSLRAVMVMLAVFLMTVGQAMVRGLPISECGCFGELISLPLWAVFAFDSCLFAGCAWMLKNDGRTAGFSLDRYFDRPS